MDNDFQEKLKNVLSDPDAMAKITAIASSLGTSPQESPSEPASAPLQESVPVQNPLADLSSLAFSSDPRLQLLTALKPLLRDDKRDKIDALAKALTVASMMKTFRK